MTQTPPARTAHRSHQAPAAQLDIRYMRRAMDLALEGWGRTSPNPMVGAVLVRNGQIVGEGSHREFGGDHAEVVAIKAAAGNTRNGTLYVTLEPCAHSGQTPPCSRAIVEAGIARVVFAVRDPNPAAGGGAASLRAAAVQVDSDVCREDAVRLNAAFLWSHRGSGPFVALKLALSLDGAIAASPGKRTAVTGPEAQAEVHRLRAGFDAVLVGSGTADIDDPLLTVRGQLTPRIPPVRVVLDADLSLSPESRLAASAREVPVWVITRPKEDRDEAQSERTVALDSRGVLTLEGRTGPDGRLDPAAALELLRSRGVTSVLCEGGARVADAFLEASLVHRLYLFVAPTFLGREGVRVFGGMRPGGRWIPSEPRRFGRDTMLQLESEELLTRLGGAS